MEGGDARPHEEARVEELLRVNAELAAEIRNLTLARADAPRSTLLTATRGIATAAEERDQALAGLESANAELSGLKKRNEELRELVDEQVLELERLRSGPIGLLRRAKARVLRRRS